MSNNKQQTEVDWLFAELKNHLDMPSNQSIEILEQAKEMEKERMIKLIQFVVSEKELVDYSSVSNYTANYYLDKFNQGGNK
jgi:hypothetical protein